MRKYITAAAVGALMAIGMVSTQAQTNTNNSTATFQAVQTVTITLTALFQTTSSSGASQISKQAITTKSLLSEIGTALGTNLNGATLVAVTPLGVSNQFPVTFEVRKNKTTIADVTSFLTITQLGTAVISAKANGQQTAFDAIEEFIFSGGPTVAFDVQGLATSTTAAVVQKGTTLGDLNQIKATVAGTGSVGVGSAAAPAVVQGSISFSGKTVEPVPTSM